MLFAPFLGFRVPLLPAQILWVNMLTHGLPGVAMGAEPVSPVAMDRPPTSPRAPIIDRALAGRIAVTGLLIAAVTTCAALVAEGGQADPRSSAFLVLGLAQLGVALAIREPGAARRNTFLTLAVAGAVALQVAGVTAPPLQTLLGTEPLPASLWPACVGLAAVPGLLLWLVAAFRRRRGMLDVSAVGR
jgi:Ca2+-transporting ATPase